MSIRMMGVALGALVAFAGAALAETESKEFNNPKMNGKRVDWCADAGKKCGQGGGVRLYCQSQGYDDDDDFASAELGEPTVYLNSGKTCDPDQGGECRAITKVTCTREAKKKGIDVEASSETDIGEVNQGGEDVLNKLGGEVQGELSAVTYSQGNKARIAVFARGMDNALWWQAGDGNGKWFGWKSLGGVFKGSPSCTSYKGSAWCAVRGMDDAVWVISQTKGKWGGWSSIGGVTKQSPSLVAGYGAVVAIVRNTEGTYSWNAFTGIDDSDDPDVETGLSAWAGWKGTDVQISTSPTCIVSKADKVHCYQKISGGKIIENVDVLNNGPTVDLKGLSESQPGVLFEKAALNIRVLARGLDDKLWVNRRNGSSGKWGGFKQKPYTFYGKPVCVDTNADSSGFWCFGVGGDKSVVAQRIPASTFSGQ